MALYAFDGTWNVDHPEDAKDTNVVKCRDLYDGTVNYQAGVGTRLGGVGRAIGGVFGAGGRSRVRDMIESVEEAWRDGDKIIDVVGFSRGSALAVHFVNKLAEKGIEVNGERIKPEVRFLGLWDLVASFGLSFDTLIDFQAINIGWDVDSLPDNVKHCFHAMALDERRETFNVTRLDPKHEKNHIEEVWFRGVHSDVGGGNENSDRSNLALQWMLQHAVACGLPIDEAKAKEAAYSSVDRFAKVSENNDPARDERRKVLAGDVVDASAESLRLVVGERHTCQIFSEIKFNWSGVHLESGARYRFTVPRDDRWSDKHILCGPDGWKTEDLPWLQEKWVKVFESRRRYPEANWFELIGAYGDEDDHLFRLGKAAQGQEYTADRSGDLYLFANDLNTKYDNNDGDLFVTVERVA